jgi:hypothetical protein
MAKKTVQDIILDRFDKLEKKIDDITTVAIPKIMTDMAVTNQEMKSEAKLTSRTHGMIWGGITLLVSLTSLAVAYLK